MGELAAVLFDVDGTLADTERNGHRVAFNRAFADVGLDWSWSEQLYGELLAVSGGKERILYYLERFRPDAERPADDLPGFAAKLHVEKNRHYKQLLAEGAIPLRTGVKRLLQEARAEGLKLAIATTTSPENVSALLHYALEPAAESWFEVIGAGDIVSAKKPAPDIYDYVLEQMKLKPEQCLVLEDSANGVKSSLAAAIETVVTVNMYTRDDDFSGAALVVDQIGDPGQPFSVLSGSAGDAEYLDVPLMRCLLSRV